MLLFNLDANLTLNKTLDNFFPFCSLTYTVLVSNPTYLGLVWISRLSSPDNVSVGAVLTTALTHTL